MFNFHRCVDHFLLPSSCVSLAFSANGNFLATAHVDDLGIYLWNNRSLFTQISLRALEADYKPRMAPLPGSAARQSDSEGELADIITDEDEFVSPEQIADSLVTLSLLPDSRWKNLLNLDAIKVLVIVLFLKVKFSYLFFLTAPQQAERAPESTKIGAILFDEYQQYAVRRGSFENDRFTSTGFLHRFFRHSNDTVG